MNEKSLSSLSVARLRKYMAVGKNENRAEPGGPDLTYTGNDRHGWVEFKVVHSGELRFQRHQLPWFRNRLRHAGRGLWLLAVGEEGRGLYLYSAAQLCSVSPVTRTFFRKPWSCLALERLPEPSLFQPGKRWDWAAVASQLLG